MPSVASPTHARLPTLVCTLRLVAVSVVFAAAYALANHLTGQRADVGQGVFDFERAIPFVPWTVVPYLSIIVLYACAFFVGDRAALDRHAARVLINLTLSLVCYALFPLRFTFERPLPDGVYGPLFELLGAVDLPYNRAPSLHISMLLILWLRLMPSIPQRWRGVLQGWFVLIGASVLTTYQHHLIDIPAGLAVGAASVLLTLPAGGAAAGIKTLQVASGRSRTRQGQLADTQSRRRTRARIAEHGDDLPEVRDWRWAR